MATVGQINIAMTTDTAPFVGGLNRATGTLNSFSARIVATSNSVGGLFAAIAGGAAASAFYKMAKQAAELEDSLATVDMVFGGSAGEIEAQAEKMAVAFGLVKRESAAAAGSIGAMLRGSGFDEAAAAAYSNTLIRLAADYKAAFGGTIPEALARISSGLRGEVDPLEKFGVTMSAANVEAQALKLGLQKVNGEFTSGQIIQARAALILDQSKTILGQAANQADGAAMQIESLSGRWENLTTTIGEAFAPVVGAAMGDVGVAVEALRSQWDASKAAAGAWATESLGGMEAVTGGVGILETAVRGVADAWQIVGVAFHAVQAEIVDGLRSLVSLTASVLEGMDWIREQAGIGSSTFGEQMRVMADSMADSVAQLREGVAAEWSKPWASEGIGEAFDAARAKIKAAQASLASEPMTLSAVDLADASKIAKAGKMFGEAMFRGSASSTATILRTRSGGGGKDPVADNTKLTAKGVQDAVRELQQLPAKIAGSLIPLPIGF